MTITVRIPINDDFEYKKCRDLYKKCKKLIGDDQSFDFIVNNTFFYSFYLDGVLIGCIYCFLRDDNLFINAFATRHHHKENLEAVKMVLSWFNCDVYAESIRKPAILCLLRSGFKKFKDNIYIYRR